MLRASSRQLWARVGFAKKGCPSFSTIDIPTSEQVENNAQSEEDRRAFLHHGQRPRHRGYEKFRSPQKRASKLLNELNTEAINKNKENNPQIWQVDYRVGDAIEIEKVSDGGVDSTATEKVRGVVIGLFKKGLSSTVLIRDIILGQSVERRIPLHSPLVRSIKVIEKNFIFKGKRKVKRAKLYYLRDKNPNLTKVTGAKK